MSGAIIKPHLLNLLRPYSTRKWNRGTQASPHSWSGSCSQISSKSSFQILGRVCTYSRILDHSHSLPTPAWQNTIWSFNRISNLEKTPLRLLLWSLTQVLPTLSPLFFPTHNFGHLINLSWQSITRWAFHIFSSH